MAGMLTLLLGICVLLHICANVYAGCDDCGSKTCPDGQPQSCHPVKNRCVCHPSRKRREQGAVADAEVITPKQSGHGCLDCGYVMCNNGRMRCDTERGECVCPELLWGETASSPPPPPPGT